MCNSIKTKKIIGVIKSELKISSTRS